MEKIDSRREGQARWASRRFVKVAPPSVHAGIGDALRLAYAIDGETRSVGKFQDLLDRLK